MSAALEGVLLREQRAELARVIAVALDTYQLVRQQGDPHLTRIYRDGLRNLYRVQRAGSAEAYFQARSASFRRIDRLFGAVA